MRAMAEATIAAIPERRAAVVGRLTGMAYALTREELRAGVLQVTTASYAAGAAWLRSVAEDGDLAHAARGPGRGDPRPDRPAVPAPELVPDEVIYAAFEALAG